MNFYILLYDYRGNEGFNRVMVTRSLKKQYSHYKVSLYLTSYIMRDRFSTYGIDLIAKPLGYVFHFANKRFVIIGKSPLVAVEFNGVR